MQDVKQRAKRYYNLVEGFIGRHRFLVTVTVLVAAAIIMLCRRPDILFNAQFWAEDGAVWYTDAYHNNLLSVIFRPYPDYLAVVQRVFASIAALLPMERAPLFLNLTAMGAQLLPIVLLMSGRLKRIIPSELLATGVCLLYVNVQNADEVFSSFTSMQWLLGVSAFLVLVAAPSKKLLWRIFDITVLIALGLSGPPIFMLLPVAFFVWRATKDKQQLRNLVLVGALVAVQLFTLLFVSSYERVGGHPAMDFLTFVQMIVGQIFTAGILGGKEMAFLFEHPWQLYGTFYAGLVLVGYIFIKGPLWLKLLNAFAILTIASMLLTLKPVEGFDAWKGLTNPTAGQRYWYFAIIAMLANLLWLAFAARNKLAKGVSIALLVVLLGSGISAGWKIRELTNFHYRTYTAQFKAVPRGDPFTFPINPGGWKVILYKK